MIEKKKRPGPGRPPKAKTINRAFVLELASKGHSIEEISEMAGVAKSTLRGSCLTELMRGRLMCGASLRAKQFELAMNGNATMLIFLGKQILGQHDRQEVSGINGGPITYEKTDLAKLSDSELADLERIVEKAYSTATEGSARPKQANAVQELVQTPQRENPTTAA